MDGTRARKAVQLFQQVHAFPQSADRQGEVQAEVGRNGIRSGAAGRQQPGIHGSVCGPEITGIAVVYPTAELVPVRNAHIAGQVAAAGTAQLRDNGAHGRAEVVVA